jgi:hypothetical protein
MDLVHLIVILIFVGVGLYLIGLIPMDAKVLQIIRVLVILAVLLYVLGLFFPSFHNFKLYSPR